MTMRGRDPRHGRLHGAGAGARASRSTSAPTSGRSAACSTRCSPASARSRARTPPTRIAAVVTSDPDWTPLPAIDAARISRLLRRCLVKDRRNRLPDIAAARLDIDDAQEHLGQSDEVAPAPLGEARPAAARGWRSPRRSASSPACGSRPQPAPPSYGARHPICGHAERPRHQRLVRTGDLAERTANWLSPRAREPEGRPACTSMTSHRDRHAGSMAPTGQRRPSGPVTAARSASSPADA